MILLNPKKYDREHADEKTKQLMLKTIEFFENKGLAKIKEDDQERVWYDDFLEFIKKEEAFATLLTPSGYGDPDSRWDMWRIEEFNEILGFYGLCFWYTWQVTILGLGPIWMGENEEVKHKTAQFLKDGGIFAFGLSEKEHGADIYGTDLMLYPQEDGTYKANGDKYYIGNGNEAALVSVFGKVADTGEYVFFVVDTQHPNYECVKKIDTSGVRQAYVAEFALHDYPITDADILSKGPHAWDSALNTVNVGKYELGWASIGICEHSLYEAMDHAANRSLYKMYVTDFPHVKKLFTEAYARLVAMKLFALRACDYFRSASPDDRRYLLYNPIQKMKVTMEGEVVIGLLHEITAAKGFEQDTYFEMAIRDIGMLPKLEGTTHVNMALVVKFLQNFMFNHRDYPEVPKRNDPANDEFLFNQGPTKGLSKIQFEDYNKAFDGLDIQNLKIFREQIKAFTEFLTKATPDETQQGNIDYMLKVGELFTLIPYSQLICENKKIYGIEDEIMEEIFKFIVSDFSAFATRLYTGQKNTEKQQGLILKMIQKPVHDDDTFMKVWENHVYALKGQYKMNE
ncbi:MAG TPA: acyl-CoA dehydrogenase [Spirochaetota bacterium]|nr:acyl-CoA dehydrogenase [Spirochaetota bacterium]